jgi:uncharacterized FlaG/YvyC family protein
VKSKQRNRRDNQFQKQLHNQLSAVINETKSFANYLYYQDMDKFFNSINLAIHDKINAYRLCLVFGFIYDKETSTFKTEAEDIPENEMLGMLKQLIPSEKLVFNYKKEEEI